MDQNTETVSFDGQGLRLDTLEDAEVIRSQLEDKMVGVLVLQGNTFGIEAAEAVGLELANQPCLREAHFKDLFTSRGREEVPVAMGHLLQGILNSGAQLRLLDLSDNAIGPIGAPSVLEYLNNAPVDQIEKFYLNNCGLGPEGSSSIAASLPNLKNLREFICGRNRLENKGAASVSTVLRELPHIELLKFNQNGIKVEGITKLADAFIFHQDTLRVLDLSDNTTKFEGSTALSNFIKVAKRLEVLHLDDSLVENEGFTVLADALSLCPNRFNMTMASFEGNELSGQKIVDTIQSSFVDFQSSFTLNLLENEFTRAELERLSTFGPYEVLVDDVYSDDDSGRSFSDNEAEEGEICDNDSETDDGDEQGDDNQNDKSGRTFELENIESELREVVQDFIKATSKIPSDSQEVNSNFQQMISFGYNSTGNQNHYQAVQIICEELGLMKCESTRKKKNLARDAIIYIGKRSNELPRTFREFFEVVVKNNDDMSCGKMLFEKLEI